MKILLLLSLCLTQTEGHLELISPVCCCVVAIKKEEKEEKDVPTLKLKKKRLLYHIKAIQIHHLLQSVRLSESLIGSCIEKKIKK